MSSTKIADLIKEKVQLHEEKLKLYSDVKTIEAKMQDDESRDYYEACLERTLAGSSKKFEDTIRKYHENIYYKVVMLFDEFYASCGDKEIVLFGAGHDGAIAVDTFKRSKYATKLKAFIDNDSRLWGQTVNGVPVVEPAKLTGCTEYIYIVTSSKYYDTLLNQLLSELNIPQSNIFERLHEIAFGGSIVVGSTETQYFDFLKPVENEIYIDGGCFNGQTVVDFVEWSHGDYEQIYIFEPLASQRPIIEKKLKDNCVEKYTYIQKGVWDKDEICGFNAGLMNSDASVDFNSKNLVEMTSIDNALNGAKITFLKFDVEGSELKGLKGAQNTIRKHKPRLAISIYHRPEDVFTLPSYILELNPDYKFYIRHYYSIHQCETVLFAI